MRNGLGSPFYKILFEGKQLEHPFTRVRVVHAEEEDDTTQINLEMHDATILDGPEFNEHAKWTIVLGYMNEVDTFKQDAYIETVVPEYDKDGIKVTVTLKDKFAKIKKVKSNASYGSTSLPQVASNVAQAHGMGLNVSNVEKDDQGTVDLFNKYFSTTKEPRPENRPKPPSEKELEAKRAADNKKFQVEMSKLNLSGPKKFNSITGEPTTDDDIFGVPEGRAIIVDEPNQYEYKTTKDLKGNEMPWKTVTGISKKGGAKIKFTGGVTNFDDPFFLQIAAQDPTIKSLIASGRLEPSKLSKYLKLLYAYREQNGYAQGNQSHAAAMSNMGKKEPGGRQYVTGHGNTIHVFSRNFKQKPIATYTYKDSEWGFVQFKPETNAQGKEAAATAVTYTGWDKKKKKPYSGIVTNEVAQTSKSTVIGGGVTPSYIPGMDVSYGQDVSAWESSPSAQGVAADATDDGSTPAATSDSPLPYSIAGDKVCNPVHDHVNGTGADNEEDVANYAVNKQQEANEKLNPASLTVPGNVLLKSGKMVGVMGVGKRFSSNYYITKVVHELSQSVAYTCTCELIRNTTGNVTKLADTRRFLQGSDKTINTKVADKSPFNNTRKSVHSKKD